MQSKPRPSRAADVAVPRREALAALGLGAAGLAGLSTAMGQDSSPVHDEHEFDYTHLGWDPARGEYVLPPLPYAYDALEPSIDEQTMRLHHDKHHAGYVKGLNGALAALQEIREGKRDAGELKRWSRQLAFNGSGHFLHVCFWNCMGPDGGGRPEGMIAKSINESFASFRQFADQFKGAAGSVEGSGWGLLVLEPTSRQLLVMQAEKHQNLTAWGVIPLVAVDVWEHAYYLKYQNRRKEYVENFMNVVNWHHVDHVYSHIMQALEG